MSRSSGSRRALVGASSGLVVFIAASLILSTVVVGTLLNLDVKSSTPYRAIFADASTLQSGDPVRIAGVEVGRVTSVRLRSGQAVVSFKLDHPHVVTADTTAAIHYANLLGNRYLDLLGTGSGSPLPGSSTIGVGRTTPALDLSALFNGFQPLFQALTPSQVNDLTANIISTFQGEGTNIAGLVSKTAVLTNNLGDRGQVIDSVVTNLTSVAQLVAAHDQQLASLIDQFDRLATDLGGQSQLVSSSLASAAAATSNLSSLVGSIQPSFETSVTGLTAVTATLQKDQSTLDGLIGAVPGLAAALDRVAGSGTYLKFYLCETTLMADPGLYIGPTNSLLGVQLSSDPLLYVALYDGIMGGAPASSTHTPSCQP